MSEPGEADQFSAASPSRPTIGAVSEGWRPRWSVMIPTYNCDDYLEQTLQSVLSQLPDGAQIEVVDDCSTIGNPEELVRRVGRGRVSFFRQPENVGHTRTFNTCIRRSRGELVHLLHGDDFVLDGFYARMGVSFDAAPTTGAAVCRHSLVDENGARSSLGPLLRDTGGHLDDWLRTIASGQLLKPPAVVVRRSTYERIGGYNETILGYGEDWEMWVRVAAETPVWFEPEPLAAYRVRPGSLSSPERVGGNMKDMRVVLSSNRLTMARHLPSPDVRAIDRAARTALSRAILRRARRELNGGSRRIPAREVIEAIRFTPRPAMLARSAVLLLRWSVKWV